MTASLPSQEAQSTSSHPHGLWGRPNHLTPSREASRSPPPSVAPPGSHPPPRPPDPSLSSPSRSPLSLARRARSSRRHPRHSRLPPAHLAQWHGAGFAAGVRTAGVRALRADRRGRVQDGVRGGDAGGRGGGECDGPGGPAAERVVCRRAAGAAEFAVGVAAVPASHRSCVHAHHRSVLRCVCSRVDDPCGEAPLIPAGGVGVFGLSADSHGAGEHGRLRELPPEGGGEQGTGAVCVVPDCALSLSRLRRSAAFPWESRIVGHHPLRCQITELFGARHPSPATPLFPPLGPVLSSRRRGQPLHAGAQRLWHGGEGLRGRHNRGSGGSWWEK